MSFTAQDEHYMRLALDQAARAAAHGDVPVGAVVVRDREIIATGHNRRELWQDPTAHAEIIALKQAAQELGSWRALNCRLYVTLEPCAMCAGAIVLARVPTVIYATADPKAGAAGSVIDLLSQPQLNHRPDVYGGLLADESSLMLREFFMARRGKQPQSGDAGG